MDQIINQIGNEAGPHVTIRRLQEKRKELEKIPPPVRKNHFDQWRDEREKAFRQEMQQIAINTTGAAEQDISSMWSLDLLTEHEERHFQKEPLKIMWPAVQLQYLELRKEAKENAVYAHEKQAYDTRFREIDREIQRITLLIPKLFDPSLINVDKRFPVERCGQDKEARWYDRWLTEGLKEKKPIFFDDHEKYIDALCRYYHEIYWATAEREKAEKEKAVAPPAPEPEKPVSAPDEISSGVLYKEFYGIGEQREEPSEGMLRGRISRIYRGGK